MEKHNQLNPFTIFQLGLGVWSSKVILAATKLELFTILSNNPMSGKDLIEKLEFADRCVYDFFDTLVSLGFLERDGILETSVYRNTELSAAFLDKNSKTYLGGILELANDRYYVNWGKLEDALKTGQPQIDVQVHTETAADKEKLKLYAEGMSGIDLLTFMEFAKSFDFSPYKTVCDVGGGNATFCIEITKANPDLKCYTFDLPGLEPLANEKIEKENLTEKVEFIPGDFFKDSFPVVDMLIIANVLTDWDLEQKKYILRNAYNSVNDGGIVVIIDSYIDSDRRENLFSFLISLTMLVSRKTGFSFGFSDLKSWAEETGFKKVEEFDGPVNAAIAYK